jgi:hypothetical protein
MGMVELYICEFCNELYENKSSHDKFVRLPYPSKFTILELNYGGKNIEGRRCR